jgi:hypothetical protein
MVALGLLIEKVSTPVQRTGKNLVRVEIKFVAAHSMYMAGAKHGHSCVSW